MLLDVSSQTNRWTDGTGRLADAHGTHGERNASFVNLNKYTIDFLFLTPLRS